MAFSGEGSDQKDERNEVSEDEQNAVRGWNAWTGTNEEECPMREKAKNKGSSRNRGKQ